MCKPLTARPDIAEFQAAILQENAARKRPRPVCPDCGWPFQTADRHPLFRKRCWSCGEGLSARVLRHLIRRLRRRTVRRLAN
jgi:hypothetical protein